MASGIIARRFEGSSGVCVVADLRQFLRSLMADLAAFRCTWDVGDGSLIVFIAVAKALRAFPDCELRVLHGSWMIVRN